MYIDNEYEDQLNYIKGMMSDNSLASLISVDFCKKNMFRYELPIQDIVALCKYLDRHMFY